MLDFSDIRTVRAKSIFFKLPDLWCFVIGTKVTEIYLQLSNLFPLSAQIGFPLSINDS
jgi:hypothetical protein